MTVVSGGVIAIVELGVSLVLQLLLKSLGILGPEVHTTLDVDPSAWVLALALFAIALVRSVALFLGQQSGYVAMETINARLRRLAIWEMLLHPARKFVSGAAVNARVGDLAVKSSLFCYYGANLLGVAVQAIALVPLMVATAPGESVFALLGLGLVGLFVLRLNRRTRAISANVPAELRHITAGIQRVARNSLLVRVLRTERMEHRRLTESIDRYAEFLIRAGFLGSLAASIPPFVGVLLLLGIILISQQTFHTPGLTLVAFLYLLVRFVGAISNAATLSSNASTNWAAFDDSLAYVGRFNQAELEAAMASGRGDLASPNPDSGAVAAVPDIDIVDLNFTYPGSDKEVLRSISVHIDAGSQLGIVGPSGCGKSTLLGLLLGLLTPTQGTVRVGGEEARTYFDHPSHRVGYVGAEPFLIAGTLRENLEYGASSPANADAIQEALRAASLEQTVAELPGRLDYVITEDGSGLSAGQKQRLCLARALLGRPQVLVLDEVSANLDAATEKEIASALAGLRQTCTTIIVSHRSGILAHADRIVRLGDESTTT